MTATPKKQAHSSRMLFILFILYGAAYGWLRYGSEITLQTFSQGGERINTMASNPSLPHWRQQLWRALFSPAMVAEEEGYNGYQQLMGLYFQAQDKVSEGQQQLFNQITPTQQQQPQRRQEQPNRQQQPAPRQGQQQQVTETNPRPYNPEQDVWP